MNFPAWKKYELLISGLASLFFFVFSTFGVYKYIGILEDLTATPPQTYAVQTEIRGVSSEVIQEPTATPSATPTRILTSTPTTTPSPTTRNTSSPTSTPKESSKTTATPQPENNISAPTANQAVLSALNEYRLKHGKGPLLIEATLQTFAQSRADYFTSTGGMDNHAGFQNMLNESGFEKMGFNALGENSSFGEWNTANNLIETIYGGSSAHNESQLRSDWTHVGIGINGTATNIVFGGNKR